MEQNQPQDDFQVKSPHSFFQKINIVIVPFVLLIIIIPIFSYLVSRTTPPQKRITLPPPSTSTQSTNNQQNSSAAQRDPTSPTPNAYITMDIATSLTSNGKIAGTATLQNNSHKSFSGLYIGYYLMGPSTITAVQNNGKTQQVINRGSIITYDEKKLDDINEKSSQSLPFVINFPGGIKNGQYILQAEILDQSGRPISLRAAYLNLSGTNSMIGIGSCKMVVDGKEYVATEGPIVSGARQASGRCTVTNATQKPVAIKDISMRYGILHAIEYPSSSKTDTSLPFSLLLQPGESQIIDIPLPKVSVPQVYEMLAFLQDRNDDQATHPIKLRWTIKGPSARIEAAVLNQDYYAKGDSIDIAIHASPSMDLYWGEQGTQLSGARLEAVVTDTNNNVCATLGKTLPPTQASSGEVWTTGYEAVLSAKSAIDCQDPTLSAKVVQNNNTLANLSQTTLTSASHLQAYRKAKILEVILYLLIATALLLFIFVVAKKNKLERREYLLIFLFCASLLLTRQLSQVYADTLTSDNAWWRFATGPNTNISGGATLTATELSDGGLAYYSSGWIDATGCSNVCADVTISTPLYVNNVDVGTDPTIFSQHVCGGDYPTTGSFSSPTYKTSVNPAVTNTVSSPMNGNGDVQNEGVTFSSLVKTPPPPPPPAPTGVSATNVACTANQPNIQVSWDPSSGATFYDVYRSNGTANSLSTGSVGYWTLDESGTSFADSSGNGDTGTAVGTTQLVGQKYGNSRTFNGSSDQINVMGANLHLSGPLTLSAWAYPAGTQLGGIIDMSSSSSQTENYSMLYANGTVYFQDYNANIPNSQCTATGMLATGSWQHILITYSGGAVTFYKNGSQYSTCSLNAPLQTNANDTFKIGYYGVVSTGHFQGNIDEVGIWNRVLSQSEITQLSQGIAPQSSTLLASPTSTSYTDSSVSLNSTYTYSVSACNQNSCSAVTSAPSITSVASCTPTCNSGVSCSGSCTAPANTCSTNNGTQGSCVYTTYSGGGSCTQASAPDQSCTLINNCSAGYTCVSGSCVAATSPTPSVTVSPACIVPSGDTGSDITISWTNNAIAVTYVDVSTDPNFGSFSNKAVSGNPNQAASTTGAGFSGGFLWQPATTYYIRTWNGYTHSSTYTFNGIAACTLSTDLTVNGQQSITGTAPLNNVAISATKSGNMSGTMNYTFWNNCSSTTTSVSAAMTACGSIPAPTPGTCTSNTNGWKCDAVSVNPETISNAFSYASSGTYYVKVIVEQGPLAAQDQTQINLPNTAPAVSNLTVDPPSSALFCGAPNEHFSWTFSDAQDGSNQTAYQLQVSTSSNFSSLAYDPGRVSTASTSLYVPVSVSPGANQLAFNTTYFWRVQVFDSQNASSGWANGTNFATPVHAWPQPAFIWTPTSPDVGDKVTFTDQTIFAPGSASKSWAWNISPLGDFSYIDSTSSSSQNPHVTFSKQEPYPIILTSTDNAGSCSTPASGPGLKTVNPRPPLPKFKEVQ